MCEEFYRTHLPKIQQHLYKVIYHELLRCNKQISVCGSLETIKSIYEAVLDDHPELFFVDTSRVTFSYGTYFCIITVRYVYSKEQIQKINTVIQQGIDGVAQKACRENSTAVMVIKYIHDYIIRTVRYDMESFERGVTQIENQNIVGVFLNHKAVCEGIAKSVQLLLNRCGILCSLVKGKLVTTLRKSDHAWNIVNIDGKWYHLDVTLDIGMSQQNPLYIGYDYFNLDDKTIKRDHDEYQLPVKCEGYQYNYFHIAKAAIDDIMYLERYLGVGIDRKYKRLYFQVQSDGIREEIVEQMIQKKLSNTTAYGSVRWTIRKNEYQKIYEIRLE